MLVWSCDSSPPLREKQDGVFYQVPDGCSAGRHADPCRWPCGSNRSAALPPVPRGCARYCGQMVPDLLIPQPDLFPGICTLRHWTSFGFTCGHPQIHVTLCLWTMYGHAFLEASVHSGTRCGYITGWHLTTNPSLIPVGIL